MGKWTNCSLVLFCALSLGQVTGCATGTSKQEDKSTASTSESSGYQGHGASSVDAKTLERFAPPPLDPATSRTIQKMLEISAPGMGLLTPDRRAMYFSWGVTGTPQTWKLTGPLQFPTQVTSGNDVARPLEVTPDGKYLIVSLDRAGEEDPGIYLQDIKGGPLKVIQHEKGVRTYFIRVTDDSKSIFFRANDIKPDSYALYRYDIASGKKDLLFSEPGLWFVADVIADSKFLLGRSTGSLTREFYEWELKDRKLKPVIGQNEKEDYDVAFGATPGEYLVLTPKFGEFKRLYRFKEGKLTALTPEVKMDVESFTIDDPRRRIYVQWNDNGYTRLAVHDARSFGPIALPEFKGASHIYVGTVSRDGRTITLGVETSLQPRTSYVYDWNTKKLTQWVKPSMPEVDVSTFVPSTVESYPAKDGTSIPMLVTRPKSCASDPCPVVVHFHGGPEGQSRPGFNRLSQIFVKAGFVFVEPNVRGSEGYGKSWLASDDGPKRLQVIGDIEDCSSYIRKAWAKNGKAPKIGVMGWSYGGYSTLMAMSRFAGSYDAGVALVGMSNLRSFLLNTAPYRRSLRISEYGDPEKDREALEKLSPTTYLAQIRDPLMIIQGVSDPRVPAGEAIQMHELLKSRGVDAPLILFANEGHGSVQRQNQVLELGHTLKFFHEKLMSGPESK